MIQQMQVRCPECRGEGTDLLFSLLPLAVRLIRAYCTHLFSITTGISVTHFLVSEKVNSLVVLAIISDEK